MSNRNLQDETEDDILSVGDVKIRQMIKNLSRVEAPKDFDFRVKARIAKANSTDFKPRFLPVLRYVLPLSVVVLVLTFAIVNGIYFGGSSSQTAQTVQPMSVENNTIQMDNSPIVMPEVAKVPVEAPSNSDSADSNQPKVKVRQKEANPVEEQNLVAIKTLNKAKPESPKVKNDEDGRGSRTISVDVKPKVFYPRNIFPSELTEQEPNNENKNDILAKQILLPLGIEIASENGNRRVKSVKKESVAERSGVKVGDLVEAIDGETVSGDAVRGKKLEGKQITVTRGAEKVEITFDNQQ